METHTTEERLAIMETTQKHTLEAISEVKNDVKEIKTTIDNLGCKLDEKYAAKWVEKGIMWAIGIVMTAVIGAILGLVIIK